MDKIICQIYLLLRPGGSLVRIEIIVYERPESIRQKSKTHDPRLMMEFCESDLFWQSTGEAACLCLFVSQILRETVKRRRCLLDI